MKPNAAAENRARCDTKNDIIGREKSTLSWRVLGASATGTSHQRTQTPCQDAFDYRFLCNGLIVAVADGAGSARWAKEGADLAVQSVLNRAEALLRPETPTEIPTDAAAWEKLLCRAFRTARDAVCAHAASVDEAANAFAGTLLLAIFTEGDVVCGLIGDCALVIQTEAGELISLCKPQKGEYANMTNFLTQPNALEVLDLQHFPARVQNAALFTDGLLEMALNLAQNRPYAPFFDPLFAFARATENASDGSASLAKFLGSEKVNARTEDDKTLLLIHRLLPEKPLSLEAAAEESAEQSPTESDNAPTDPMG